MQTKLERAVVCVRIVLNMLYLIFLFAKHQPDFLEGVEIENKTTHETHTSQCATRSLRQKIIDNALGVNLRRPIADADMNASDEKEEDQDNNKERNSDDGVGDDEEEELALHGASKGKAKSTFKLTQFTQLALEYGSFNRDNDDVSEGEIVDEDDPR